jgi:CelD/BcsL family acetyltransferase involved in cellulose biosynthesis
MARALELEVHDSFDHVRDEWDALATTTRNLFATPLWLETWWRHFGRDGTLRLVSARSDGEIVAFLPLFEWRRRPIRVLRFLGGGAGDELGPVAGDRARLGDAVEAACRRLGAQLLVGEHLPKALAAEAFPRGRVLTREGSPIVRTLGRSWEEYLAGRSANLRQQVRRRERRLARDEALTFRLATEPERLEADLDLLFALHAERWGDRDTGYARREAFHRELAREAARRGLLRLWFLELRGEPVAAWHGYRFAGVESYFQAGRRLDRDDDSVGFVLLAHTIRAAFEDGVDEYRFLRGAEPFKYRFAEEDPGLVTVACGRGLAGVVAAAAAAVAAPVKRRLPL